MGNVVKRKGLKLNNQNLIVLDDMEYPDPDHYNKNHAFGLPINYDVAQMMIKDLWDNINAPVEDYRKKPVAFAIGKETLLSILSQEDCIGVRFYLANFKNSFFAPETHAPNRTDGLTLISVGIEIDKSDPQEKKDKDIGARGDDRYIVTPLAKGSCIIQNSQRIVEDGEIREMVPPFTIEDFKARAGGRIRITEEMDISQLDLADIINNVF